MRRVKDAVESALRQDDNVYSCGRGRVGPPSGRTEGGATRPCCYKHYPPDAGRIAIESGTLAHPKLSDRGAAFAIARMTPANNSVSAK